MARHVIVVGDTLAPRGDTVTTGSNADIVDSKPVADKGDMVDDTQTNHLGRRRKQHVRRCTGRPARASRDMPPHAGESQCDGFHTLT
ncbi:hypothetical protein CPter291_1015 [Collimonas pratensis]|uniref:Uncharacterized protein n=1 Tax=Collimonas pratensis TaxID=279113 RepID=A0ABM5Z2Z0_9BURK|nr:hypothetical protein CPter291_1015 [Collimonas pratensis]